MMDPIARFSAWMEEAKSHPGISEPTAMTVATVDGEGKPSARILLLKGHDARGFTFYTNSESRKGEELKHNPHVALCFYWMPLQRQVRIEGSVTKVEGEEADAYFASRRRESRIGAWASQQSRPLENREVFMQALAEQTKRFEGKDVPRPAHWYGWRLAPERMEFWQEVEFRLHDRDVYTRNAEGDWNLGKLYP
ncbi:MAG: pyridoxamine 5'-phosphate oxidase [Rickettsiales bacterium]|nr:pyridoxamine 5'-phosphate oxidase [Rickettsiales bacterium]